MFFSNQRLRYKRLLVIIIPLFIALIICGFFTYHSIANSLGIAKPIKKDSLDIISMDYHLRSNATDYQKELFNELSELINDGADDATISESVVKNYIADAYTWDNKKGQWDVGGMCYVYSPMKNNIYYRLRDEFYGMLNKYIDQYGSKGLLEVSNIETVSLEKGEGKFEVDGNAYDCYIVHCKWQYTNSSRFASEIDNDMMFDVIKNNDGRFEIVVNYEFK